MDDAVWEVNEFWRELIAWFEDFIATLARDRGHAFCFTPVLVCVLEPKLSFRANKIVTANVARAEAARKHP